MFASQVHRLDTEPKDGANSIQLHGWRVRHTIVNFLVLPTQIAILLWPIADPHQTQFWFIQFALG